MSSPGFVSPYLPCTEADRRAMLDAIGVESADELFRDLPRQRLSPALDLPHARSELELRRELEALAKRNTVPGDCACFLGAGAYRQFTPAVVRHVASRGEFLTSYTPYQPEVSQGTLQATYEFQTLVCLLTGMEVANAGMYDGSTALAEAGLMAARVTRRPRVAVLDTVSPTYREVMATYSQGVGVAVEVVRPDAPRLGEDVACLVVQQPNFLGYFERLDALASQAREAGALLVVSPDPVSLGMFRPPGDYDADIVAAEGQSLGIAPSFGGPYVGLFACKEKYLRQMPGRIVGRTSDTLGRTGYVLTIQAREQHIRRQRATSNICTAVGLMALQATAYMAALGKHGLRRIAELCYHKAHYAADVIAGVPGYSLPLAGTFFREFVVACPIPPAEVNRRLLEHRIIGGLDVSAMVPNGMLLCVTEMNSRDEIDRLAEGLARVARAA